MWSLSTRAVPNAPLSITAIAAIATGIGIILLCLVALVVLLVRAVRIHKRLLADLEERGVSSAQVRGEVKDSISRPRTVLRRNTILPFNAKSGWDTLTSMDTLNSAETPGSVAHYVPPKPTEDTKRASRLSWPFSARRMSGHDIHMKTMKSSRLSTVMEDPKPSALVPVLKDSHPNSSRPTLSLSGEQESRTSSSQSLLQHHPALRKPVQAREMREQEQPGVTYSYFRSDANNRLQRAKSVAAIPSAEAERPQLRARSASLYGQASGIAPDVILPPLPFDIARIKSESKRHSQLRHVPSQLSVSSFGSADSSVLANRMSPVVAQNTKTRPQKITKPRTKGSAVGGPRPFRDTLDLRTQVLGSRHTANGSTPRASVTSLEMQEPYTEGRGIVSPGAGSQPMSTITRVQSVTRSNVSSPTASPIAVRNVTTPKRKLKMQVSSEGSPERHYHHNPSTAKGKPGAIRSPKRQHSQASSRSSGGNPFQWDPAPLCSTSKPSALKGSPSARQGHRRKNSVKISLVPTFHGPPSRTPSPSMIPGKNEDTAGGAAAIKSATGLGLELTGARSLPTPPSSSTFAPDLKVSTTSLRASLTTTSPTLPLVNYDQSYVVFPTDQVLPPLSLHEQKRLSNGSVLSLSKFPATPCVIEPDEFDMYNPVMDPQLEPQNSTNDFRMPGTPSIPQHPFRPSTPEQDRPSSQSSLIDIDGYDPERPSLVFQPSTTVPSRAWQSEFPAIPEESSVTSHNTLNIGCPQPDNSLPVSPTTVAPPKFSLEDRSAYNLPVYATTIPEETPDTIDPAMLSKVDFTMLNSSIHNTNGSLMKNSNSSCTNLAIVIPSNPASAQDVFNPLLAAAFPSSPPATNLNESPVLGHLQSEPSSLYSSPTSSPIQLPSPLLPCSPRPPYAQLPNPSLTIDFSDVPKLAPSPRGPRGSPPRPLRSSIAALRRMNSDAADAKKEKAGRGERRYLRLGREGSLQIPGDESWLDEIEDDVTVELDEAEGRRLVGDVLDDWEEDYTVLDLEADTSFYSDTTIKPGNVSSDTSTSTGNEEEMASGADREKRSSNIWEDGEKFWMQTLPPRPGSPNKPKDRYQPLASSPLASPALSISAVDTKVSKKRDFQVAKDVSPTENTAKDANRKSRRDSEIDRKRSSRYRKRNVLGNGTPNVRIQVTSPNGHVVMDSPGNLYDSQGFLQF